MKKSLFLVFMLALAVVANAQEIEFKKRRLGLAVGFAKAGGENSGGGVLFVAEPGYHINRNFLVNLRLESTFLVRDLELNPHGIFSCTGGGMYYLSNKNPRLYIGAGLGFYGLVSATYSGYLVAAELRPGFYPRIGVDWRRVNINLDYNYIINTELLNENSYIGLRVGIFLLGRR
jgi:hypothetical protein